MISEKAKRKISGILATVLVISTLSACGSTDKTTTADTAKPSDAAQTVSDNSVEPATLDVFIDFPWYWTDKFEGVIPEEITKETGITLKPTRAVDDTQLGVMIASNDLPDMIYTDKLFDRLSSSKFSYSWDELISKYDAGFKPSDMAIEASKSYAKDDHFYTILNASASQEEWKAAKAGCPTLASLLYREDILKELGNPPMKTLDDYMAVMGMVKQKYPDMTPLVLDQTFMLSIFKIWMIPNWCPGTSQLMETDDKKLIHYTSAPEYIDFLKYANKIYQKGYMTADNFAYKDGSQATQMVVNNQAFSYSWYTGSTNDQMTDMTRKNGYKDATWLQTQPMVENAKYVTLGTGWAGVFITKNNKDPEKSIKLMDWMFSEKGQRLTQWGREGTDYTMDETGIPKFSDDWITARADENVFYTKYNPAYYFGISSVTEAIGRASGVSKNALEVMDTVRNNLKLVLSPALSAPKEDTDEKVVLDQINEYVKNQEVKVILSSSDAEFQKNYDEMLQSLKKIGVQKLEETLTKSIK